jgi:hypothetical protein
MLDTRWEKGKKPSPIVFPVSSFVHHVLCIKYFPTFTPQTKKNQPMKIKFFILMVLFLGIGAFTYAQTTAAPAEKKDAPAQVTSPEKGKTGECTGHQAGAKSECKWVDANNDGKCDTCGKTEKECKEKCAPASEPKKEGCAASCPMHKECGESSGTKPSKDGKK